MTKPKVSRSLHLPAITPFGRWTSLLSLAMLITQACLVRAGEQRVNRLGAREGQARVPEVQEHRGGQMLSGVSVKTSKKS